MLNLINNNKAAETDTFYSCGDSLTWSCAGGFTTTARDPELCEHGTTRSDPQCLHTDVEHIQKDWTCAALPDVAPDTESETRRKDGKLSDSQTRPSRTGNMPCPIGASTISFCNVSVTYTHLWGNVRFQGTGDRQDRITVFWQPLWLRITQL
jgi:hypothetical protein